MKRFFLWEVIVDRAGEPEVFRFDHRATFTWEKDDEAEFWNYVEAPTYSEAMRAALALVSSVFGPQQACIRCTRGVARPFVGSCLGCSEKAKLARRRAKKLKAGEV